MKANPETPRDEMRENRLQCYNLDSSSSTGSQFPGPCTLSLNLLFKAAVCLETSHGGIWMPIKNP